MTNTEKLAQFVKGLQFTSLPDAVVEKAKAIVLHSWGVQLAASTLPWSKINYRYARSQGGPAQSTVVGYGDRVSVVNAAYANGCFAHAFEIDDNHARTGLKGGAVAVPTAVAVGEDRLSSGTDVITALVIGFELMARAGLAVGPSNWSRNTHMTGTVGAIGAAAITGRLTGMDEQSLVHALGIGAAHRAGFQEGPPSGRGHIKRTFPAMAAAGGIRAALLAADGMTGPATTLDAGSGLCQAFDIDKDRDHLFTEGLGEEWEILNVHYKIWAQDGYIQPMTEALERIRQANPFSFDDIDSVWVGTHVRALHNVVGVIKEPKDLTDAQFSANFSVALYLRTGGAAFDEYTEENINDPAIRDLSRRIVLEIDDEIEEEFQRTRPRGAKVRVRLKSGQELFEYVPNLRELNPSELDDKFRRLSTRVISDAQSEQLVERAHELERVRDISALVPLLVR